MSPVPSWYRQVRTWSLAREREAPRIVATSTPSRIVEATFLEPRAGGPMDVVITRGAGLDVHKATVVATVRVPTDGGGRRIVTETFGTMTPDLLALREWLQAYGVTHVALESTGVYWKPVYYVLEDAFTLLLINMQALQRVP